MLTRHLCQGTQNASIKVNAVNPAHRHRLRRPPQIPHGRQGRPSQAWAKPPCPTAAQAGSCGATYGPATAKAATARSVAPSQRLSGWPL